MALYSDKHIIFRVAHEGTTGRNGGLTQYGRALAKAARSDHDAHRPLREDDNLEQIFTWQETRTMSREFVVHYKRVTYLVQPNEETRRLAGNNRQVDVLERADGTVEIRYQGQSLPYLIHEQQSPITQGEVVENKRLGAVLAAILATHATRDAKALASPKRTHREKARLREARLQAGLPEVPTPAPGNSQQNAFAAYSAEFMSSSRNDRPTKRGNVGSNAKSRMRWRARLLGLQ